MGTATRPPTGRPHRTPRDRDGLRRLRRGQRVEGPRPHGVPVPPRRHGPADAAEHRRRRREGHPRRQDRLLPQRRASCRCARRWPPTSAPRTGSSWARENVAIEPGGKPVIGKFILALMDPGDEVLYPNPGYPIYESQIEFHGGVAKPYGYVRRARTTSSSTWTRSSAQVTPQHQAAHLQQPAEPHRRRELAGGAGAPRRVRRWPTTCSCSATRPTGTSATRDAAGRWPRCPAWPSAASSSTRSARSSP